MKELIDKLSTLFNYGEIDSIRISSSFKSWLVDQNWLIEQDDYFIISKRWIDLSAKTNDEEYFIKHLLVFYPDYQQYLLLNLLEMGVEISRAEDKIELSRLVSNLPE